MLIKNWKKDILTIPNLLSLFRLLLIPVYVVIYLNAEDWSGHLIAAGVLAVSCLTDMIDGKIARHFNMISNVGKILDPLADKATQLTLILCLAVKYPVLWSLVALFVVKEGFQVIAGFLTLRKGRMLTGALMTGKVCTTILFVSLILMVMVPSIQKTYIHLITLVNFIAMLVAFLDYARTYFTHSPMIQDLPDSETAEP
ncbi:MAG: CDP-alcohol phosphatidyltransferase family protein [Firmicutes bacterium]|nr:CDP-alcohol phosphatidyltransferase family protein [Bacillota bacterium]